MALLWLGESAATRWELTGAKAAQLAKAYQFGFPVLPGFVVSADESRPAVESAAAALEAGGPWPAQAAAMGAPITAELNAKIMNASARLGGVLAVRSSSPLEDGGPWSGAFASHLDVRADEVGLAVHSCWASLFSKDALQRCLESGVDPPTLRMAVLIQPSLHPDAGGLASLESDGSVRVSAIAGSPAPLLAGWVRGLEARDTPARGLSGPAADAFPPDLLRAVVATVRDVWGELGEDVIEWATTKGRVVLLQTRRRVVADPERPRSGNVVDAGLAVVSSDLIRATYDFRGPLGERWALPWTGGSSVDWRAADPVSGTEVAEMLREVARLAEELTAQAWGRPSQIARAEAARAIAELRGPRPADAVRRLAALQPVEPLGAARLFGIIRGVAANLVKHRLIACEAQIWSLSLPPLRAWVAGHRPTVFGPLTRDPGLVWEPFLFSATAAVGIPYPGEPAVPGTGVGRLVPADLTEASHHNSHREVLFADRPLPALAPRLWTAAGLVVASGSPAAHLVEVARFLRVPTLINSELGHNSAIAGGIAAVDAEHGFAYVLED